MSELIPKGLSEFEIEELMLGYRDVSESNEATSLMLAFEEYEQKAYKTVHKIDITHMPVSAFRFFRGLAVEYHQHDPSRKSAGGVDLALSYLQSGRTFINIFCRYPKVPILGRSDEDDGEPELVWDVYEVGKLTAKASASSLVRLDDLIAGIKDPSCFPDEELGLDY